jgi:transmembrane sensor
LKKNDIDRIDRYINEEASENEFSYVESLFNDGENNLYLRHSLERDWDRLLKDKPGSETDLAYILDHIHHIISRNEIRKQQRPLKRIVKIYMKVAAVLLVPVLIAGGIFSGYMNNLSRLAREETSTSSLYAPLGSRVSFTLPDGTNGMLNSGSSLTYSFPFTGNRKVKLEGEAWFEVKHDENQPFEISTGSSVVKVTGTSFNMSAYLSENYVEVVLKEGRVEFSDKKEAKGVTILASERLVYHNGKIEKSVADPSKFNAWTEGRLVFRGDPMTEVARRIERWYNVKVIIADPEIKKYSFRATFHDDPIEDVIRFLCLTSPIRCSITPPVMLPDGILKKEEVVFFKK